MRLIDTYEVVGFSYWASALFNGDHSGLEEEDEARLTAWLNSLPEEVFGDPIDYRYEGFRKDVFDGLGGDAYTYIFPIYEES